MDASDWPIWLGIYPLHTTRVYACRGACGRDATGFAVWLVRGRSIVVSLCERCCDVAMCTSTQRVRTKRRQPKRCADHTIVNVEHLERTRASLTRGEEP